MKKIAILLPNLNCGGAERLSIHLAHEWNSRGYEVEFVLMRRAGELLALVDSRVNVVELCADRIREVVGLLRRYLRTSKPDVLLASMWPLTTAAVAAWLLAGRVGKLVLSDHVHLRVAAVRELNVSPSYLRTTVRATYRFASAVIAVSKGVAEDLRELAGFPPGRIRVIYNPVATGRALPRADASERAVLWGHGSHRHILSVGTLKAQKNHTLLIRAFSKLPHNIDAKLTILGEGDLRPELEALVRTLGLEDRVLLPGYARDPYAWFVSSDLFVLSSDWEGFGNVIVEALECGVPVVSTDCQSGPAEILEEGRYGTLVPVGDCERLSRGIADALLAEHDTDALRYRAQDFAVDKIADEYLAQFGLPSRWPPAEGVRT